MPCMGFAPLATVSNQSCNTTRLFDTQPQPVAVLSFMDAPPGHACADLMQLPPAQGAGPPGRTHPINPIFFLLLCYLMNSTHIQSIRHPTD